MHQLYIPRLFYISTMKERRVEEESTRLLRCTQTVLQSSVRKEYNNFAMALSLSLSSSTHLSPHSCLIHSWSGFPSVSMCTHFQDLCLRQGEWVIDKAQRGALVSEEVWVARRGSEAWPRQEAYIADYCTGSCAGLDLGQTIGLHIHTHT